MSQKICSGYRQIEGVLRDLGIKKLFLVCGHSFERSEVYHFLACLPGLKIVRFSGFGPNPRYDDICVGVNLFNSSGCEGILAAGGGSAIDTAKCIKLYCKMDPAINYLKQECLDTKVPFIALPTTAGTGSESTHFAVIYYEGEKQSVAHESVLPDYAVLEPLVLGALPVYQKKCTMLDALCQGIESWWSVHSTEESRAYSKAAIRGIVENWRDYIQHNTKEAAEKILWAANNSGRAINITQTTAAHAMSYKITSMYGLPHGHAVAVCLPEVWEYMLNHPERCVESRGADYLQGVFSEISAALDCRNPQDAAAWLKAFLNSLDMSYPASVNREEELAVLTASVNPVRLKNNPVELDAAALRSLYERIVKS